MRAPSGHLPQSAHLARSHSMRTAISVGPESSSEAIRSNISRRHFFSRFGRSGSGLSICRPICEARLHHAEARSLASIADVVSPKTPCWECEWTLAITSSIASISAIRSFFDNSFKWATKNAPIIAKAGCGSGKESALKSDADIISPQGRLSCATKDIGHAHAVTVKNYARLTVGERLKAACRKFWYWACRNKRGIVLALVLNEVRGVLMTLPVWIALLHHWGLLK